MTTKHETMARKLCELRGDRLNDYALIRKASKKGGAVTNEEQATFEMKEFDDKMQVWQAAQGAPEPREFDRRVADIPQLEALKPDVGDVIDVANDGNGRRAVAVILGFHAVEDGEVPFSYSLQLVDDET